jgi:hypothetical protein
MRKVNYKSMLAHDIEKERQRLNAWVKSGAYKRAYCTAEMARKVELERRLRALKGDTLAQTQPDRFPDQP